MRDRDSVCAGLASLAAHRRGRQQRSRVTIEQFVWGLPMLASLPIAHILPDITGEPACKKLQRVGSLLAVRLAGLEELEALAGRFALFPFVLG